MNLGQFFPKDEKLAVLQEQFEVGRIFRLYCEFTQPRPKDKYLLLTSISPKILFFFINSEIHNFIKKDSILIQSQIFIKVDAKNLLEHDSYIDCMNVIENFTIQSIIDQVNDDMNRIKGVIDQSTRLKILNVVNKSKTLTDSAKSLINKNFNATSS